MLNPVFLSFWKTNCVKQFTSNLRSLKCFKSFSSDQLSDPIKSPNCFFFQNKTQIFFQNPNEGKRLKGTEIWQINLVSEFLYVF